jgi:translocator protein
MIMAADGDDTHITRGIDLRILSASLVLCIGGGMLSGVISGIYGDFTSFVKPDFYPPGWTFSVVWTVLYTLMGISLYIVLTRRDVAYRKVSLIVFGTQFALNLAWSPVFFIGSYYLAAFVLLIAIMISTFAMIAVFLRVDRTAALLQLPYAVWLCIAAYLSYSVYILN